MHMISRGQFVQPSSASLSSVNLPTSSVSATSLIRNRLSKKINSEKMPNRGGF